MDKELDERLDRIEEQLAQLVMTISNVYQQQASKEDIAELRAAIVDVDKKVDNIAKAVGTDIALVEQVAYKAARDVAAIKVINGGLINGGD